MGGVYKIKLNRWTDTYYIYRFGKPVTLAKALTQQEREFVEAAVMKTDRNYFVWEGKKVK